MIDLKLDPNNHDIVIEGGDLILIHDLDWLVQKIKIKLLFFFQEWFLDQTLGIDYFSTIFGKDKNQNTIDNLFILTIKEQEEIIDITEYQSEIDNTTRSISVTFRASSIYGEIIFDEGFSL